MRIVGLALVGTVAALAASACGESKACTQQLGNCGLHVALQHGTWEPGTWRFEFVTEGGTSPVELAIPAVENRLEQHGEPWGSRIRLENGVPVEASFLTEPASGELVVLHDGVEVARQQFTPNYTGEEIWGEGCGVCNQAAATLAF